MPAHPTLGSLAEAKENARGFLDADRAMDAVRTLEEHLTQADGDPVYRTLLQQAYRKASEQLQTIDPTQAKQLQTKLALLSDIPVSVPEPVDEATLKAHDSLRDATTLFQQAKQQPNLFGDAAKLFASCLGKVELTQEQTAAWAYCRIRVAADRFNQLGTDPAVARETAAEVRDALALAPNNAKLQAVGQQLIAAAEHGVSDRPSGSMSFTIQHSGQDELARMISDDVETLRGQLFARWSGPVGGAWMPKCIIVLHNSSAEFAQATGQPVGATGKATVTLNNGEVTERRIDLRADDPRLMRDALPRELMHVILADLFPFDAPPEWATIGMTVLAASESEQGRYLGTLQRIARSGSLTSLATLMQVKTPDASQVTSFHVASLSLVKFLVHQKGERAFTSFLRDASRYGTAKAVQRQYGVSDLARLDEVWRQSVLR